MAEEESRSTPEYLYEMLMVGLAFLAVSTIWYDTQFESEIVWGTWGIFFVDFVIRLFRTKDKWGFIKSNPFIVIAVIPLDAIFQFARIARILHFFRLKVITKYYAKPAIKLLVEQKLIHLIPGLFLTIFISTILLYWAETERFDMYLEAWVGSVLSLAFFGYAYIEPESTTGTIVITFLTVLGVIFYAAAFRYILSLLYNTKLGRRWMDRAVTWLEEKKQRARKKLPNRRDDNS
ncbi:hypothetical protein [Alkalicoccus chagannorensis]|uniref:hypothetical protein n=1 Tax=Alkalicoccus chagannorensis TaxID=427072 RepID=UPI0004003682|nr:hypothetical protein [Alkalicoccus chagannorensis]